MDGAGRTRYPCALMSNITPGLASLLALATVGCMDPESSSEPEADSQVASEVAESGARGCHNLAALAQADAVRIATQFLGGWANGTLPKTQEAFLLRDVLAPEFWLHAPGMSLDRAGTIDVFFNQLHGALPDVTHAIDDEFRTVACGGDIVVLESRERLFHGVTVLKALRVTTVYKRAPRAPGGVLIVQMHETDIDVPAAP